MRFGENKPRTKKINQKAVGRITFEPQPSPIQKRSVILTAFQQQLEEAYETLKQAK